MHNSSEQQRHKAHEPEKILRKLLAHKPEDRTHESHHTQSTLPEHSKQCRAMQGRAERSSAKQDRAKQSRAEQVRAE